MSEDRKGEKNSFYGKSHSEASRRKISDALTGEKNPQYGKPHSKETKRKISDAKKGTSHSKKTKRKMSDAKKGTSLSEETKRKMSDAKETPKRTNARKFFFSLPSDMDLGEKRKHLRQKFPEKHRGTIFKWCKKFESERLTAPPP